MSLDITCDICYAVLDRQGALIFGPPDDHGNTKKRHVCVPCWQKGPTVAAIVAAVQDDQERELLQAVVDASRSWLGAWSTNVGRRREPEAGPINDLIAALTALNDLTPELDSDDQNLAEHTALTRGGSGSPLLDENRERNAQARRSMPRDYPDGMPSDYP